MTPLLTIDDVSVRFPVGRRMLQALDHVSLSMQPGETLALVGESGSGKTTLGHVVAGLRDADEGGLHFEGKALDRAARRAAQRASRCASTASAARASARRGPPHSSPRSGCRWMR